MVLVHVIGLLVVIIVCRPISLCAGSLIKLERPDAMVFASGTNGHKKHYRFAILGDPAPKTVGLA